MNDRRVAVLVDGDNVSPIHSAGILSEATKLGRVDVVRVYCAANGPSGWLTASGYRMMHAGEGKNAADLLLSIDAMELALVGGIEGFVVATSDCDYMHLAQRLRERGIPVLGLGEQKAPEKFRASCTWFRVLPGKKEDPQPAVRATPQTSVQASQLKPVKAAPQPATNAKANTKGVSEFDRSIRSMIAKHSVGGRGIRISELAPRMHVAHGTRISTYPERNWRAYLSARPELYEIDPRGPEAMVRFLPASFAQ